MKGQLTYVSAGSRPIWLGDEYANYNLMPNGAKVKANTVTPINGVRTLPSGSLVGRGDAMSRFVAIPHTATALTTNNPTVTTLDTATGATVIQVADTDGYAPGGAITVNGAAATIAANGVDLINRTITLTAGLAAATTAGAVVAYSATVPLTEVYLSGTVVHNADELNDFTLVRNNGTVLVYQNGLPNWAAMSAFLKGELRTRYKLMEAIL